MSKVIENMSYLIPRTCGIDIIEYLDESVTGGKIFNVVMTLTFNDEDQPTIGITLPTDYWGLFPEQLAIDAYTPISMVFGDITYRDEVLVFSNETEQQVDKFTFSDIMNEEEDDYEN